jgi:hypothetical protein
VYQAVEKMFWSMVHRQRRWTGYCIPLMESQGQLVAQLLANNAVQNSMNIIQTTNSVTRYSGLNVAAISRHGTVEFRHFNNPQNEAQMNEWINVCMSVKIAGQALRDACTNGVMATVNATPSLVVDTVMANTVLSTACVNAGISRETMQLEVDQLLAITESLYSTAAAPVSQYGISIEELYGNPQGIVLRHGTLNLSSTLTLKSRLLDVLNMCNVPNAATYAQSVSNDCVIHAWPAEEASRERARINLSSWFGSYENYPEIAEAVMALFSSWEQQWDDQREEQAMSEEAHREFGGDAYEPVPPAPAAESSLSFGESNIYAGTSASQRAFQQHVERNNNNPVQRVREMLSNQQPSRYARALPRTATLPTTRAVSTEPTWSAAPSVSYDSDSNGDNF